MTTLASTRQAVRVPIRTLLGVQISGTGSYTPESVVTNEDLQGQMGLDPDWVLQRTGIRQRRFAPPGVATSDLAVEAARRCIATAEVDPDDIDLLILATFTPDSPLPSTACRVQERLGLHCPAMDVQAACAGFMYAMITAMQFVANGCSKLALVIGAECMSRVINPRDQRTYPLFGDGAGAVLLAGGSDEQGLVAYSLGSDGTGADLIRQQMGGSRMPANHQGVEQGLQYLEMQGRPVFKWAIRVLNDTVRDVTEAAGVTLDEVDLFIAHQANLRIIDAAAQGLGISTERVFTNLQHYGNTSAGSVPLALDEACQQGYIRRGNLLLLSGFGAGLNWGTSLLRW